MPWPGPTGKLGGAEFRGRTLDRWTPYSREIVGAGDCLRFFPMRSGNFRAIPSLMWIFFGSLLCHGVSEGGRGACCFHEGN